MPAHESIELRPLTGQPADSCEQGIQSPTTDHEDLPHDLSSMLAGLEVSPYHEGDMEVVPAALEVDQPGLEVPKAEMMPNGLHPSNPREVADRNI